MLNAIVGSLIQIGVALLIGTPIGIMAGTYLAEDGKGAEARGRIRFVNDILLVGAVDPDRPLRLSDHGRPDRRLLGLGGCGGACDHRPPGRGANDRGHARLVPDRCARRPSRSARRSGR